MIVFATFLPLFSFFIAGLGGRFMGRSGVSISCIVLLSLSLFLFLITGGLSVVVSPISLELVFFGDWLGFIVSWSFLYDILGIEMSLLITTITLCVVIYSSEYMFHDPYIIRFLAYLSLFCFFMLILVSSGNLLQVFIGWEGVGLVSFLLINFWFMRLEANRSALKAMIFNRVGDSFYLIVLVVVLLAYSSVDILVLNYLISYAQPADLLFGFDPHGLVGLGLFLAAVGKSAQLGLHAWLPDAMEGPTPVSSLLHSATMVTAGVFLLIRFSSFFFQTQLSVYIAILGGLTAFLNALFGFFQWDLKKIIAFSTCSQLGLMVVAVMLDDHLGFYHLVNHGFFKALLFLSAGSVIHAISNEQDIRRMGGLFFYLPFTSICMLIGSGALAGFPFLTGFYSKERILFSFFSQGYWFSMFLYTLLVLTSIFTALYSLKILLGVFYSSSGVTSLTIFRSLHEAPLRMVIPMSILSFFSIIFGFLNEELFVGPGRTLADVTPSEVVYPSHKWFLAFFFVYLFWSKIPLFYQLLLRFNLGYFTFLFFWISSNRFGFISIYRSVAFFFFNLGYRFTFLFLDRGVFEKIGPTGIIRFLSESKNLVQRYQITLFKNILILFGLLTFIAVFGSFFYPLVILVFLSIFL